MFIESAPVLAALFAVFSIGGGTLALVRSTGRDEEPNATAMQLDAHVGGGSVDRVDVAAVVSEDIAGGAAASCGGNSGLAKRVVDVAASFALLLFLAPLILLTAIAVKLDSPGPILYRQRRIGFRGAPFYILKFRSMRVDAERNGAQWAAKNDARITRIGRFIRKTRIDEIPQAINVLRGEMSFVGPRPERPEFVSVLEKEIPNYQFRHMVRPGITGWAQVKYVYGASIEDARTKLEYDLHYIKHYSLWRDLLIIVLTVRVALFGLGSR